MIPQYEFARFKYNRTENECCHKWLSILRRFNSILAISQRAGEFFEVLANSISDIVLIIQ